MKYRYIVVNCKKKTSSFYKTQAEAFEAYNRRSNKRHLGILRYNIKKDVYEQIGEFGLKGKVK